MLNSSRITLTWEAYMHCLIPIFYITNNIDNNLILLFVKWYFRNICVKTRNFNNLAYSEQFIKITNNVFKNKNYNYYETISRVLTEQIDEKINKKNYISTFENIQFKHTSAKYLLLFYITR